MIYTSVCQIIGRTPLLELKNLYEKEELCARVLAKLESRNPGGSAKDRVALSMLEDAREKGLITPDTVILEPTSGNTGIGLACVAASWGLKVMIIMPDSMSIERQKLMKAFGAELVLTPGKLGMQGAIDEAKRLQQQIPGSIIAGQFENSANPMAHYKTTGPEIWEDTQGDVDIFVAGVGTGGTITGTGMYLKEKNSQVQVVAVEPADSPLLTQGWAGSHGIQGIGANFVPQILNRDILDAVIPVTQEDACTAARKLGKTEGVLAGISSGAALYAALILAKKEENRGKTIVVLLPDTGERYLSAELF